MVRHFFTQPPLTAVIQPLPDYGSGTAASNNKLRTSRLYDQTTGQRPVEFFTLKKEKSIYLTVEITWV
jgi:hypothetical protein